jgi:hypothetical protein
MIVIVLVVLQQCELISKRGKNNNIKNRESTTSCSQHSVLFDPAEAKEKKRVLMLSYIF